jgi:hydroxymethylpyrimidine pyrophosphatase-like HAD family hydrolase
MNSPLLVSTDFDGTLIGSAEGPLFEHFAGWLEKTRQTRPVVWAINTGRNWDQLAEEMHRRRAPVWPDYAILIERFIHQVSDGLAHSWEQWNEPCRATHAELFIRHEETLQAIRSFASTETSALVLEDVGSPVGLIARDDAEADRISQFLRQLLGEDSDLIVVRNSVYFRLAHRSYQKGSCLTALAEKLSIPKTHIFAVGDHWNDLPMLDRDVAHHMACPANAIPDVKAHVARQGGFIATKNYDHGVVEALVHYFA